MPTAHLSLSDPGGGRARARAGRGRGRARRVRRAVHARRPAARPSRQRPGVRRRAGPRRAVRDPPDVRAAVDEGHAHGHVGERQAAAAARVGHRVRRRAPPVHDAVRLRRVRQVPAAQGARARVGRRLDRLLARPHRRRLRAHVHRHAGAARAQAERLLPRAGLDLVRPRRAHHPGAGRALRATGSCGRRTSRTPTTRPSTSTTSTSWPARSPRATRASSSATTPASCSRFLEDYLWFARPAGRAPIRRTHFGGSLRPAPSPSPVGFAGHGRVAEAAAASRLPLPPSSR